MLPVLTIPVLILIPIYFRHECWLLKTFTSFVIRNCPKPTKFYPITITTTMTPTTSAASHSFLSLPAANKALFEKFKAEIFYFLEK